MRPQGLTTAKTVAKVSVVSDTAGEEERGTPIHMLTSAAVRPPVIRGFAVAVVLTGIVDLR